MDFERARQVYEQTLKDVADLKLVLVTLQEVTADLSREEGMSLRVRRLHLAFQRIKVKINEYGLRQIEEIKRLGEVEDHPDVIANFASSQLELEEEKRELARLLSEYGEDI